MTPARALAALTTLAMATAVAASGDGLFASYRPLELTLRAPLEALFESARRDDKFTVGGTLEYPDSETSKSAALEVKVSVRGHTSRRDSECSFPKLKLKFGGDGHATMFEDVGSLRLGTHCGEQADDNPTKEFGRLANEKSPIREAFVYRLLDAVEVPALKARPARITYVDTRPGATPLTRNALLLEDEEALQQRLKATAVISPGEFTSARDRFQPAATARLALAEAMVGNFDWCLRMFSDDSYRCDAKLPLWNIIALEHAEGPATPVLTDFDLAGMVVGSHNWFGTVYGNRFAESGSSVGTEVLSQVQRTRSLFSRAVLDEARAHFLSRRDHAYNTLAQAELDARGRDLARRHLDAFYAAIADAAFYRPVIVRPDTVVYASADRSLVACAAGEAAPAGTPVNIVATDGDMAQVAMLDVHWRWAPPRDCPAVRNGTVWIAKDAVGTDYPVGR